MTAGAQVSQYLELAAPSATPAPVGHLTIVTEPPGARVSIDGQARGVSPVTVRDLEATSHKVTVVGATGSSERTVEVEPGGTTSVVFALGRPGVTAGYLSVQSAFNVQIAESGDIVGSSATPRVMMAAGQHQMTFSNAELGFEERRQVEIRPGATTTVRLDAVAGLNINARPWADVSVDGVSLGQTPIANYPLPLGSHQVVFRHPQLGERRQTVVVTTRGPNRISMDLTR
jgi:serine/threonine-protein kinase